MSICCSASHLESLHSQSITQFKDYWHEARSSVIVEDDTDYLLAMVCRAGNGRLE